jgi:hypothetical protein
MEEEITLTEARIQADFIKIVNNKYPKTRGGVYHVPNGGKRNEREANKLKAMGVLAGIPDVHTAIPAAGYASLYIEFKETGNKTSDRISRGLKLTKHEEKQQRRQAQLRSFGNKVVECDTTEEAVIVFEEYLKGTIYLT